jgi:hypothetical protein
MEFKIKELKKENRSESEFILDEKTTEKIFQLLNNIVSKTDLIGAIKLAIKKVNIKELKEFLQEMKK